MLDKIWIFAQEKVSKKVEEDGVITDPGSGAGISAQGDKSTVIKAKGHQLI